MPPHPPPPPPESIRRPRLKDTLSERLVGYYSKYHFVSEAVPGGPRLKVPYRPFTIVQSTLALFLPERAPGTRAGNKRGCFAWHMRDTLQHCAIAVLATASLMVPQAAPGCHRGASVESARDHLRGRRNAAHHRVSLPAEPPRRGRSSRPQRQRAQRPAWAGQLLQPVSSASGQRDDVRVRTRLCN